METNFGPLSSKSNIKLEFDVIVMFLPFYCLGLFTDTSDIKISQILYYQLSIKLNSKGNTNQSLHTKFFKCFQDKKQARWGGGGGGGG